VKLDALKFLSASTILEVLVANKVGIGHFLISRLSETSVTAYTDGLASTTLTILPTVALTPETVKICGAGSDRSTRRLRLVHFGSGLTTDEIKAMHVLFSKYIGESTNV
jgi:hypothetical protein